MECPKCSADVASYDKVCAQCGESFYGAFEENEEHLDEETVQARKPVLPCPACGGQTFSWGDIDAHHLSFHREEEGFLARAFGLSHSLPARLCESCGNIQIFSKRP